LNYGERSAAF